MQSVHQARIAALEPNASSVTASPSSSSARPNPPKSCFRQPPGGGSAPPRTGAYMDTPAYPPRHNRRDSLHRRASRSRQTVSVSAKARPAFARGCTQVHDPDRPALKRAPTPFHYVEDAGDDDQEGDDDDGMYMEEEYVTMEAVVDQVAGFLSELSDTIGVQRMRKYVPSDKVYALHEAPSMVGTTDKAFGVPVRTACAVAPCLASFAGQLQQLPLVVFVVIEEIYGRGLDVSCLFRIPGDEKRVNELVAKFSAEPYGDDVEVDRETIPDLCGLLQTWLNSLPIPIFDPLLEPAFFSLVVCGDHAELPPDTRVRVAQLIIRLLPAPNLSLFVYLLSFLSHFQRATKLHAGIIAGLFAKPLAAKPVHGETENAKRARRDAIDDAKEIVKWLIVNWNAVIDGLMDEQVLEVNPFDELMIEQVEEPANMKSFSVSAPAERSMPAQQLNVRPTSVPVDSNYVTDVATTLDGLSLHLGAIRSALDGSANAQDQVDAAIVMVNEAKESNVRASIRAAKIGSNNQETENLKRKLEEVEAQKAKVEKKLSAAQKALTAALAL